LFGSGPSTNASSSYLASPDITVGTLDSPLSLPGSNSHWLGQNPGHRSAAPGYPSKPFSSPRIRNGIADTLGHTFRCSCGFVPGSPLTRTALHRRIKPNDGLTRNKGKRLKPPTETETPICESVPRCSPVNTAEDKWPLTSYLNNPQPTRSGCSACTLSTCK
jgi:hypothetical protein